jgi:hypothetical protein
MADALTRFGLSRRPASEMFGEAPRPRRDSPTDLFGAADMRGPGWSDSARRAVEEHQAALDEEATIAGERAALEDQRIAREREREAEAVADEFTRIKEPSAREKFFDENEATMVGSKRYNALAKMRQRQPSFADNVLAKNLANKIDDPDERNVFLGAVAKGAGTLAAREEADRFRMRRGAVAALTKAGVHPTEANRIADEEGYSPEVINYHVAQQENESSFPKDRQAQALEKRYRVLKDRASLEDDGDGITPQTAEELRRVSLLLDEKYKLIAEPFINGEAAADAGAVLPRSQRTPAAAPAAAPETPEQKMRKKYNID